MTNKIEIMAPVGSYEALMGAIQGGAGSVYFGVGPMNMRSRSAANFSISDLEKITAICKEAGIRSYLTLNTIIYDHEIEEMHQLVDAAKSNGVSVVIASDLSVLEYARKVGMEVHISTQCNITNLQAVKFYSRYADVMVTARELKLSQVAAITKAIREQHITGPSGELVQIEIFAHGALCMAVSGKCYLSLDNFNESANRGACLQPCRREYIVKDADHEVELKIDNKYIMSPKDLKTIDFLDQILAAGVRVLKIEGRGRSAEYVKTVTETYRAAADAYFNGTFTEENLAIWNQKLASVYNRGFWNGYYLGQKMGEWSKRYGSQATRQKVYIGKITNYFNKIDVAEVKIETHTLSVGDEILIIGPTTGVYEDRLGEIRYELETVSTVEKGQLCSIPVKGTVRRNDKLYKWIDSPVRNEKI
ncbi:MAG: peptidase U32 family protein [Bacteroidota bacterium]|nr:peptidase U32 family protein [Bacteroidota bacterium]